MPDDSRRVVAYLTAPESDEYIAVMAVLEGEVTDRTPAEITSRLRSIGIQLDQKIIETRLDKLVAWGAASPRADASQLRRYADLLARNRRYTATPTGRQVHRFYNSYLAGTPAMREIPLPSLNRIVNSLSALVRLLASSGRSTATTTSSARIEAQIAEHVGIAFTSHDDIDAALVGAEDGLAGLADRFDLDDERTAELKTILVDYATHIAAELDQGSARARAYLDGLLPQAQTLVEALLAASDAKELIAFGALAASRGGRVEDWEGLRRWFDPQDGRAARFSLRLVQALPGMHANLRRLHSSSGAATTRAHAIQLARACADPTYGTQIWQAALGDHSWRKLAGTADDEEVVRATTSWRDGPGVALPELLRTTGRTGARGPAATARDDTATREAKLRERRERQRLHAEAVREVLAAAPGDPLSDHAARVAFAIITFTARAAIRPNAGGPGVAGRVGSREGLGCTLLYLGPTAFVGVIRAPSWRVLLPGRVALFHPPNRTARVPAGMAAALTGDPGDRIQVQVLGRNEVVA